MRSRSSMSRSQNGASPQGRGVIRTSSNCDTPYLCISITLQQPQSGSYQRTKSNRTLSIRKLPYSHILYSTMLSSPYCITLLSFQ
ncbi:hypothetical protein BC629DRAFT_1736974 [Irpex lacteus]|nr:hypothetical protein BC629DRAFT_1736974 [Irpex lacteus]